MVVGLASVAVVAVLAWQGFKGSEAPGAQLAVAPQAGTTAGDPDVTPVMIRDPQLDALMAAHRQFGGTSALQMPTGFLRNATFEAGAR
jgi:sigma-E factor negative regulatory protein RseA